MIIIDLVQLVVLILLGFCMFFGLGFIINMLLKTTWLPIYVYIIFVIGIVYWSWGAASLIENIKGYTLADYLPIISGLVGAVMSGYTIKMLRVKGYKMF
ncbi:Uncharacterised protein [Chlamydia abortus]|uniref:YuiB family protein n=1 Tax=Paenibacillus residui TaxID=629724 RepID=A0ABW3D5Y0_9BACL|nr:MULTISPECIES: YuiB family protein [Paenibacillaceae]SHE13467.1 Uncharacterised protein [Chlamydia abortus]